MDLNEALGIARSGDSSMMISVARYYYEHSQYDDSLEWWIAAINAGRSEALVPAAGLTDMLTYATLKLSGGESIWDSDVQKLSTALEWVNKAKSLGIDTDIEEGIIRTRAICAYYASQKDGSMILPAQARSLLLEAYCNVEHTPELELYTAVALYQADSLSPYDATFCFELLRWCTRFTEKDIHGINLGVVFAYLGLCYLKGKGCRIDDDAAYQCFVQAGQRGFDCSETLRKFKKKLTGGYAFER